MRPLASFPAMHETKPVHTEKTARETKAGTGVFARLRRLFASPFLLRAAALILVCALGVAAWWFSPRSLTLLSPLAPGESYAAGTPVVLDQDSVGQIASLRSTAGGGAVAELRLTWLTAGQRRKLQDGVARVSETSMIWLTSEFIDRDGPPLIDGDVVPVITRAEREKRKIMAQFISWVLPGSGVGLLWLLWRGAKRLFS